MSQLYFSAIKHLDYVKCFKFNEHLIRILALQVHHLSILTPNFPFIVKFFWLNYHSRSSTVTTHYNLLNLVPPAIQIFGGRKVLVFLLICLSNLFIFIHGNYITKYFLLITINKYPLFKYFTTHDLPLYILVILNNTTYLHTLS